MAGTRVPAPSVPPAGGGDPQSTLRWIRAAYAFLQWLRAHPLLDGALVEVTLDGSGAAQVAPHPLGRVYRGAFVYNASSSTVVVVVASPGNTQASGYDPAKVIRINPTAASSATVRLWVF